jgi:hypothetical protein
VTDVSSLDIEEDVVEDDAVSVRAASDISTMPSLLSTRSQQSRRYVGVLFVWKLLRYVEHLL